MNRQEKEKEVSLLNDRVKKAKAMIFTDFRKLKVSEITELRAKLRKSASTLKVVKNRLFKRVLEEQGLKETLAKYFDGPTALATSEGDPVKVAKVLVDFAKEHEFLKLKGGYLEGKVLALSDIDMLAKLPGKEVLLSRVLASMNAPATNFVCVLNAVPQKMVRVINAIREKKT